MAIDGMNGEPALVDQAAVLAFLHQAESGMQRVDTHASIVFLGRDRALKIKRGVRLPFLDYSTLDRRRNACEEELRVNRPFAPQLYHRVVPITREADGFAVDGDGAPVEWAVEMSRFDETQGLDHLVSRQEIAPETATALADVILAAHAREQAVDGANWISSITDIIDGNTKRFRAVEGLAASSIDLLDARCHDDLAACQGLLRDRASTGFVRRCHGDLHLGNIVLIDDAPVLFDAIEFDPAIATTDILYDLAFPLMDLIRYGNAAAANTLFNRYMAESDDAHRDALSLVPLFLTLRAAIRANVLFTKSEQPGAHRHAAWHNAKHYFDLAISLIQPAPPVMVAVGGLSGTGKSALSRAVASLLAPAPGALIFRSDVIRKKLFGVPETERLPASAYTPAVTVRVYEAMLNGAERAAAQGCSVILDAAFLREGERATFAATGPVTTAHAGLFLTAERDVRLARIAQRTHDASDATASVAIQQEDFLVGPIDWPAVDANGSFEQTLKGAIEALQSRGVRTGETTNDTPLLRNR
ncbi:bifunctional aminoglycoside phosphotransferase/ATP-binding protein [Tardiphaga sp.]|uniref:bifunctional aminoglycoside phosphotransferase/ATP-binding protein n=1 Tax=Tardiphaga sp. TaxID=1926292 RepID=UPI002623279D|nr:bifunctional aminoglycoside phosphotransferase/ATP-binding protein [Tardiphaga sp.]MDB5620742.1 hypothetical protein [Tardiphaga sp.]